MAHFIKNVLYAFRAKAKGIKKGFPSVLGTIIVIKMNPRPISPYTDYDVTIHRFNE